MLMEDIRVLACSLQDALDQLPGDPHDVGLDQQGDICALLDEVHAILLASHGEQDQSDALFDAWPAIQRAAVAFPAAAASVAGLAGTATVTCNPRELFSLFLESLSEALSLLKEQESEASLAVQLSLLSLLPRLLLRMKRKWLAFLSDYLQMLLRWCTHMLPLLPWGPRLLQHEAAAGAGAGVGAAAPAAPPSLPEAVHVLAEGLASLAAFVQAQQEQQQGEQGQQQQPSQTLAATGGAGIALSPQDAATAGSYLVWTVLQLASFLLQLPHARAAAHASITLAGPAAMGKRLGALGPAAVSLLELPAGLLAVVLPLLPGQQPAYGELQQAVWRFEEQQSQRRIARAEVTLRPSEGGSGEGDREEVLEEEEEEEGLEVMLHPPRLREGVALALCSAVLSRHSTALALKFSTAAGAPAVPPGSAGSPPSMTRVPPLSLQLLQIPSDSQQMLRELAIAVQLLLDVGARSRSVPLVVLSLHCLAVACDSLACGEVLIQPSSPVASASARLGLGLGLAAGSGSGSIGVGGSRGTRGGGSVSLVLPEVQQLMGVLVQVMSFNPVEVVRSCAHEALNALLSAFAPAARLQAILSMLKMVSSAAVVVGLQRLRQEMAFAWQAASRPEGTSPFLNVEVLNIATATFRHSRHQQQQHQQVMGWAADRDVLSHADAMAAALSLYRFVLLRQQADAGPGHSTAGGSAGQEGMPGNPACTAGQGTVAKPASRIEVLTLVTQESVQSTLQDDLVPLHTAVMRLLRQHEQQQEHSSMPSGWPKHLQQRPAGEVAGAGSGHGSPGGEAAVVMAGADQEDLESWLAVQRLLDVLERVIEIAKSWQ